MTGVTFEAAAETYGKRLQLLKDILPALTIVGILRVPSDPNIVVAMDSLERVGPKLGVTLRPFDVRTADDPRGPVMSEYSAELACVHAPDGER